MCVVVAYQEMLEMEMLSSNFMVILEGLAQSTSPCKGRTSCPCYVFAADRVRPTPLTVNDCGLDAPRSCSSAHINQDQSQT